MIRSEVRARVAANQPDAASPPDETAVGPAKGAAAPPPQDDRPPAAPSRARVPWLVRNSRKATIALAVAAIAASPFAYRYLQREFGPDPFAGVKLDGVRIDPLSGITEATKRPEAKPAPIRPAPAAVAAVPAPKPPAAAARFRIHLPRRSPRRRSPRRSASRTPARRPCAGHTAGRGRLRKIAQVPPTRAARARSRGKNGIARTCTEAVTALGLCNPDPTKKGQTR